MHRILLPSLRPGQIVPGNDLSVHKNRAIRHGIEAAGCAVRFLPPFSPDFSPIEQAFSKLETALRQAGARSRPNLEAAFATGLETITPRDVQG